MKKQPGCTLIELVIVVAIIGILSAFAVPAYQNYTKKAHMTDMLNATSAIKTAANVCLLGGGNASTSGSANTIDCKTGTSNMPDAQSFSGFTVASTITGNIDNTTGEVTALGTITSTVSGAKGSLPTAAQVILTPTSNGSGISWEVTCSTNSKAFCPS